MSSTYYNVPSSSSTSASSSSGQDTPPNDGRMTIVGVVLGIVGCLLIAGVVYATLRVKRKRSAPGDPDSFISSSTGTKLDRTHPAARITPFGAPGGETPRFKHTPGLGMRVAVRRPDGAWDFTDPQRPFTPSGLTEIDAVPSPSSSVKPFLLNGRSKEQEYMFSRDAYERDYDLNPPPPAYGYDYSGHIPLPGKD